MSGKLLPSMTGPDSQAIKKLKLADADGDSTMAHADNVNAPSTPRQQANSAQIMSSGAPEMSPPDSQGPSNATAGARDFLLSAALAGSPSINANGKRKHAAAADADAPTTTAESKRDPETGYQWARQEDQPGWAWKNNRAKEEAARAWKDIVDTQYMIKSR